MTRPLQLSALIALLVIPANAQVAPHLPPLDRALPPRAETHARTAHTQSRPTQQASAPPAPETV